MAKRLMKYNPAFLTESELVNSFVVRTTDLELITDVIRDNTDAASNQHVLLIGPRGIGKTTLVLRVAAEVGADGYLRDNWYPLVFGEEAYEVSTPGEFWLEALFHLARQTGESMLHDSYVDLRRETDESRLRERALAQLMDFADQQERRILLVVENLHMLLGDQVSDDDAWVIRHTLVNEPRLMLLATAANRFDSIENSSQAMFELFKIHELQPLSNDDSRTLWEAVTGEELVGDRIRPIRILTGGNPRLLTIIAGFAMRSSFRELTTDLVDLVDDHTDYFKSHLDYLPPQERKVFVALADIWDPATASEVAATARIPVNKVSAHLSRLVNNGAVVVVDRSKGKKWYQLAERMYNIYHLMRRRGNPSARVEAIIQFMVHFYEAGDLAKRIAEEAVKLPCELREEHFQAYRAILEHAHSLSDRCKILEITPQQFLESPDMPDEIRQIIEASQTSRGGVPSESRVLPSEGVIRERLACATGDLLELVKIGDDLAATPGGSTYAEEAYRMAIEANPEHTLPWGSLGCLLHESPDRYEEAEQAYHKAIEFGPGHPFIWVQLGGLYRREGRYGDAEQAYRKALEVDPCYVYGWVSLGRLFDEQADAEKAENAYRKAIEYAPGQSLAWSSLIGLLAADPRRDDDTLEAADEYLQQTGRSADSLDDVAWGLMADYQRHAKRALSYAKEAAEKRPEETRLALTLAILLMLNDDSERALELTPLILTDSTLVGRQPDAVVFLLEGTAAKGHGVKALRLLEGSASEQALEPLICGMRMFLGEEVKVAQEIKEVAEDVVREIRDLQDEIGESEGAGGPS